MICRLIGPDHSHVGQVMTPNTMEPRSIRFGPKICPHFGHTCACSHCFSSFVFGDEFCIHLDCRGK